MPLAARFVADQGGKAANDCKFMHRGGLCIHNLLVQFICTVEVKQRVLLTSASKL
jgi:hypothetical protein